MESFIGTLAPYAMKHGKARNILPSLILAQGILETGGGASTLAIEANNLFGIKKGMGWDGPVYAVKTSEYTAAGEYFEIVAEFRKYDSYEGSVIDLCAKYNDMPRYAAVVNNFVFEAAANAVKNAGYATDPKYPDKLINIYEVYDLGRFDKEFATAIVEDIVEELQDVLEIIEEEAKMAFKVVIDAGHGRYTAGKRSPIGEREWLFNNTVALAVIAELKKYDNVEVLRVDDPTGNADIPLNTRVARANAWKGDAYVSIHHNANTGVWGTWTGTETFVYSSTTETDGSMKLAQAVQPRLVKAMGLRDRGIKKANFAVIRDTKMPAILTEGGYMDSSIDILRMRNATVMRNAGVAIAQGIAQYAGLKLKAAPAPAPRPTPTPVSNPNLFRVRKLWSDEASQIGAYSDLDSAKAIADANITFNVYDNDGDVVYNPRAARDAKLAAEAKIEEAAKAAALAKAKAEAAAKAAAKAAADAIAKAQEDAAIRASAIAIIDFAIVMNGEADYEAARKIHLATGYPMFERAALFNRKVARHVIGVGGSESELIDNNADKVTMVSGRNREETAKAADAYIASL